VLSESRRQVNAFFGSPSATWATNNPSHMLADAPSELHIAVGDQGPVAMPRPGEPAGRLTIIRAAGIPIVIVGAVAPRDTVRAIYRRVLRDAERLYAARAAHAQAVLDSTLVLHSPDAELDLAVRWAELNLDAALACNPDLGCGLVAGYGPSGPTSTRPGFGWYFGGDAAINSFAMSSTGLWSVARDGLAFFATYQGKAAPNLGKIPHEISHGAARIRWFEDYPYAFYHGDTTPFWILALAGYWQASGDTATIRRLWPNLRRAYDWAKATDADGDGLMDNARAGAGAIEVGDLQQGLKSDVYMAAVWVKALEVFPRMALAMPEPQVADEARRLHDRALATLRDKLWLPSERRYAFALLEGDKLSGELTVWPATGLAFGLFDERRGQATAAALAGAGITTDWGARTLAPSSPLFDPLHYNNGTVWPFVTGFDALGLFRYHNAAMGWAATSAVARTAFLWGLGDNPEVFSGSVDEPLETAVPQQFFATSMLLTPLVRGLLGWEADVPADRVRFAPHLPPTWDSVTVERLPAGSGRYTARLVRTRDAVPRGDRANERTRGGHTGILRGVAAGRHGARCVDLGPSCNLQHAGARSRCPRGLPCAARRTHGDRGAPHRGMGGTPRGAASPAGGALAGAQTPRSAARRRHAGPGRRGPGGDDLRGAGADSDGYERSDHRISTGRRSGRRLCGENGPRHSAAVTTSLDNVT